MKHQLSVKLDDRVLDDVRRLDPEFNLSAFVREQLRLRRDWLRTRMPTPSPALLPPMSAHATRPVSIGQPLQMPPLTGRPGGATMPEPTNLRPRGGEASDQPA